MTLLYTDRKSCTIQEIKDWNQITYINGKNEFALKEFYFGLYIGKECL